MVFKAAFFAFIFVVAIVSGQHEHHNHDQHTMDHKPHEIEMVNVTVYYESLCEDSRRFFTKQLYPSLQGSLSKYVNLTLVPYGKATSKFDTNEYQFTCHHGVNECYGNKIQACALRLIDRGMKSEGLGFNKVSVDFINCLMEKTIRDKKADTASFPTRDCANENSVQQLATIENCANHTDGSNYLAAYGELTDKFQKPIKSVPTIVFNTVYNQKTSEMAEKNFVKALCQYIKEKPEECIKNAAVSLQTSILTLVVAALFVRFIY